VIERWVRTYDVRVWLADRTPPPDLDGFVRAVREVAVGFDGISVRWVCERRWRNGQPRIRIHPPPRRLGDAVGGTR
jgi:hypothetical protein